MRSSPPSFWKSKTASCSTWKPSLRSWMETFLQQLVNGISQGSAYALIALGYTMVYGVLRLINFAHSDVYMFGAFMGFYLANSSVIKNTLGTSTIAAVLVLLGSMALSAGVGILIERFAYRPGRGASRFAIAFWLGIAGAAAGPLVNESLLATGLGALWGVGYGFVLGHWGL